jgi:predicted Zn-dependent peptidase
MNVSIERLPGGGRLAVSSMPEAESVTLGLWLRVGGRNEPERLQGVSHFIEHLLFKGTRRRSARVISQAIEGIGGYLNAFTSEEMTCYYAKVPARYLDLMADVLLDMLWHATMPREEVERERGVICEEIRMYEDQPPQVAIDRLTALMWPRQPLGRSIAGTLEGIGAMRRDEILSYRKRHYHTGNLWITACGQTDAEAVRRAVLRQGASMPGGLASRACTARDGQRDPRFLAVPKPVEQVQLAVGLRTFSYHDPRRAALALLNTIFGGNMSSRLFQEIRERRGLAYSVESSLAFLRDTGRLVIGAGLESGKAAPALRLALKCLRRLAEEGPARSELRRAREYLLGQFLLNIESGEPRMMWLGESLLQLGRFRQPAEIADEIARTTADEVQNLARFLADNRRLSVVAVGPGADNPELAAAAKF